MALNWKKHDLPTRAQKEAKAKEPVSYTHLTLPTTILV